MDFYFDIGMAVILRIIKDRRNVAKYYSALAKLYTVLSMLLATDPRFYEEVKKRKAEE
jgi:hypothetical protein